MIVGVLALGMAGAKGRGPLSDVTTRGANGFLNVHVERMARYATPDTLMVHVSARANAAHNVTIHLNRAQIVENRLQSVQPLPALTQPDGAGGEYFTFALARGAAGGDFVFSQQPAVVGPISGRVAVLGLPGVKFTQIVWP